MAIETTLLAAVADCCKHNNKDKDLVYEIHFTDPTKKIRFGKRWNWRRGQFVYYIDEPFYPRFSYDRDDFIEALSKCRGIKICGEDSKYSVCKAS